MASSNKKSKGQFYTTNCNYILEDLPLVPPDARCIMEPFAGKGDLINWIKQKEPDKPVEAYDIEPKAENILERDTLKNPPDYKDSWILTNPPYLARNKSTEKELYDLYKTNDLYKCFLNSVSSQNNCKGGIVIIPSGFFFSPRDLDVHCRHEFMSKFKITRVRFFEETVFPDTPTTVVAFSFEKSPVELKEQNVEWVIMPSGEKRTFVMSSKYNWIVGGEIYEVPVPRTMKISRHVEGQPLKEGEQQTYMTLHALDTGSQEGRIHMVYKKGEVYPAKECNRAFATLRISGKQLSEEQQMNICKYFNEYIEQKRKDTWSLFLPQYRESKEYARKRIPFSLAYKLVAYLIQEKLSS